jgi:hypothetical protein
VRWSAWNRAFGPAGRLRRQLEHYSPYISEAKI